jgi:maltose-binding protein MalE
MENFQTAEALPRIPEAPELIQVLGEAIQRAINEELSPEEALAGAQRRWEQILRVSGRLR